MIIKYIFGLFIDPVKTWKAIQKVRCTIGKCYCTHVMILAALPPVSAYFGTTRIGWTIGPREPGLLTRDSALTIAIISYFTILITIFMIGAMIYWMGKTYGSRANLSRAVTLSAFTASPLLISGLILFYPVVWVDILIALPALAYTVYLLYTGVPIMMGVSKDRGFLFSSAVLAVGLVMFVALLAVSVILWGYGIGPDITS